MYEYAPEPNGVFQRARRRNRRARANEFRTSKRPDDGGRGRAYFRSTKVLKNAEGIQPKGLAFPLDRGKFGYTRSTLTVWV